ncbi:hypothetical protein V2A60_004282 [Cordyceps javanica]
MTSKRDENEAAWINAACERLKVDGIEDWPCGLGEVRVRNEVNSLNPIEAKIQKQIIPKKALYNMFNPQFPAVLGFTYAGTFTDVGPDVSYVAPGDRVAVARWGGTARETRYAAFQKYPLALERNVLKLDAGTSFEDGSGVIANLVAVVSALTIHMGLEKPATSDESEKRGERILVHGGSTGHRRPCCQVRVRCGIRGRYDKLSRK